MKLLIRTHTNIIVRPITIVFLTIACIGIASCVKRAGLEDNDPADKIEKFPSARKAECHSIPTEAIMNIDGWCTTDSTLICHSTGTHACFFEFSLPELHFIDSIGMIGSGPKELIMPMIMPVVKSNGYKIVDNAQQSVFSILANNELEKYSDTRCLLNKPILLTDSIVVYSHSDHTQLSLKTAKITSDSIISTINLVPENANDKWHYCFQYDIGRNGKLVICYMEINKMAIADIAQDGTVSNIKWYIGKDTVEEGQDYYGNVCCGDKYIYINNRKNINTDTFEGSAEVEIYDYDMNPIAKITLDIPAWMMQLDKHNNRLLFTSPLDDDIHYVGLSKGEY